MQKNDGRARSLADKKNDLATNKKKHPTQRGVEKRGGAARELRGKKGQKNKTSRTKGNSRKKQRETAERAPS